MFRRLGPLGLAVLIAGGSGLIANAAPAPAPTHTPATSVLGNHSQTIKKRAYPGYLKAHGHDNSYGMGVGYHNVIKTTKSKKATHGKKIAHVKHKKPTYPGYLKAHGHDNSYGMGVGYHNVTKEKPVKKTATEAPNSTK